MTRRPLQQLALALALCLLLRAPALAADRIVVFDFESSAPQYAWMGPALAQYARNFLRASQSYSPVSLDDILRAQASDRLPYGKHIPFEKMDGLRSRLGARYIIEGTLSSKNNKLSFKGSVDDLEKGTFVRDISFSASPDLFAARAALGAALFRVTKHKPPAGAATDKNLIGTNNKKAFTAFWQARHIYRSGDPDRAAPLLQKALQLDKNYTEALLELARIHAEKTRFLEAVSLLDQAIRINPKNDLAQYLAGFTYRLMRDPGRAAQFLMKAVELRPDVAEYQFQLGLWHEDYRQYAPAVERFGQAARLDPNLAEAWYHLAVIHARFHDENAAIDAIENAVRAGGDPIRNRASGDSDFDIFRGAAKNTAMGHKFQRAIEKQL